ncbi:hypothetical protein HC766_09325 [Candidatus Gracilibacteria bacterium]|nr:hypothetical protein [Candidatus Gracilibacteria bacterium]
MPDEHIKRCDVRIPIALFNQIEDIAVNRFNVPLYHKTGKPQVSSTIIELIKIGIATLNGDALPDNVDVDRKIENSIEPLQKQINQLAIALLTLQNQK